jgi:hypothetical protein
VPKSRPGRRGRNSAGCAIAAEDSHPTPAPRLSLRLGSRWSRRRRPSFSLDAIFCMHRTPDGIGKEILCWGFPAWRAAIRRRCRRDPGGDTLHIDVEGIRHEGRSNVEVAGGADAGGARIDRAARRNQIGVADRHARRRLQRGDACTRDGAFDVGDADPVDIARIDRQGAETEVLAPLPASRLPFELHMTILPPCSVIMRLCATSTSVSVKVAMLPLSSVSMPSLAGLVAGLATELPTKISRWLAGFACLVAQQAVHALFADARHQLATSI